MRTTTGLIAKLCFLAVLTLGSVHAQTLAPLRLTTFDGATPPAVDLTIDIDVIGASGNAYQCVRVDVTPATPVLSDRTLRAVFRVNQHTFGPGYDEEVTAYIEIPEGTTGSVRKFIDLPQRQIWVSLGIEFHEGGEPLRGGGGSMSGGGVRGNQTGDESPGILLIDSDAPEKSVSDTNPMTITFGTPPRNPQLLDVRALLGAIPEISSLRAGELNLHAPIADDNFLLATYRNFGMSVLKPKNLSANWLSHSNADIAIVEQNELDGLAKNHPAGWEALRNWTAAGGSLVVFGQAQDWSGLPALDKQLGFAFADVALEKRGWRSPDERNQTEYVANMGNLGPNLSPTPAARRKAPRNSASKPGAPVPTQDALLDAATPRPAPLDEAPFLLRPFGFGMVVAVSGSSPMNDRKDDWVWMLNEIGADKFLWERRFGMSHRETNGDYWNFLVPGVGQAPVFSFVTLIGLFMLLIGPLNYYWLNRMKRLSLLLVTVPAAAGVFTFSLFLFALVSDGFGTRLRVRSFTELDQLASRAATISRQTYYAAFAPSGGMRFPADTAVFPCEHQPMQAGQYGHIYGGSTQWLDGGQVLARRYITARQHKQFMTARAEHSPAKLEIVESKTGIAVRNLLGTELKYALVRDSRSRLFEVKSLAADGNIEAKPAASQQDCLDEWNRRLAVVSPRFPPDYDDARYNYGGFRGRRYYYNYYSGQRRNGSVTIAQSLGRLEMGIREATGIIYGGSQGTATAPWDRSYIALTAESIAGESKVPLAPRGIASSKVSESLHVLRGRW